MSFPSVLKFSILVIFCITFLNCSNEIPAPALDQYMGDWQGLIKTSENGGKQMVAQVIAYDNGRYVANLMHKFDTREPVIAVLEGQRKNSTIAFSGQTSEQLSVVGSMDTQLFRGMIGSQGFELEKIVRLSPTLGKKPPPGAEILFDGSSLNNWQHVPDPVGFINLDKLVGGENKVVYLRTRVWAVEAQRVWIQLGSDDGIKLWLNDQLIHTNNTTRGAKPAQDIIPVSLSSGWNRFMIKISNGDGGWGVYFKLVDKASDASKIISEMVPGDSDQKNQESLKRNDGFLTIWEITASYSQHGSGPQELLEIAFAPEKNDGSDTSWSDIDASNVDYPATWELTEKAMRVTPGSGSLMTRKTYADIELHLEFRTPFMPDARGQKRGNSGVYIQGRYEVQVLDSYGLEGKDSECGGIYDVAPPLINMCAPPGQWQTYDISFTAPLFDNQNNKQANARITVRHNNIIIHNDLEIPALTGAKVDRVDDAVNQPGVIMLQNHGDLVEYRNIWLVEKTSE